MQVAAKHQLGDEITIEQLDKAVGGAVMSSDPYLAFRTWMIEGFCDGGKGSTSMNSDGGVNFNSHGKIVTVHF